MRVKSFLSMARHVRHDRAGRCLRAMTCQAYKFKRIMGAEDFNLRTMHVAQLSQSFLIG